MTNSITKNQTNKKGKQELLNDIIDDLMDVCDSILATYIADWEGLSFASKLPIDVNDELVSATTLFTLEGAEATRKELEKSLLGKNISYLILMTETQLGPAYMMVFPIEKLGYISCISKKREDMGIIIQNMKTASKKVKDILFGAQSEKSEEDKPSTPTQLIETKEEYIKQIAGEKYDNLFKKLKTLKDMVE
ncbi:MAG: hypothetical protein ACFFCM_14255 [Promethearchaeota archaeon]